MNIILLKRKKGSSGLVTSNKKKVATLLIALLVILPSTFLFTGYKIGVHYMDSYENNNLTSKVLDSKLMSKYEKLNKPYATQFNSLENMHKSLDDLKKFVTKHESKLKFEQQTLEHILNQKQTLKPLLQADQNVVDAIFSIQHQKYEDQKWLDRFVSFVLGVGASIIATFIVSWWKLRYKLVINADDKVVEKNDQNIQ